MKGFNCIQLQQLFAEKTSTLPRILVIPGSTFF